MLYPPDIKKLLRVEGIRYKLIIFTSAQQRSAALAYVRSPGHLVLRGGRQQRVPAPDDGGGPAVAGPIIVEY